MVGGGGREGGASGGGKSDEQDVRQRSRDAIKTLPQAGGFSFSLDFPRTIYFCGFLFLGESCCPFCRCLASSIPGTQSLHFLVGIKFISAQKESCSLVFVISSPTTGGLDYVLA